MPDEERELKIFLKYRGSSEFMTKWTGLQLLAR